MYIPAATPVNAPPSDAAMASSNAFPGGGCDGGVGGCFFPPPPNDGKDNLGNSGRSMIDSETSSDKSLAMDFFFFFCAGSVFATVWVGDLGGGGGVVSVDLKGLEMLIVGDLLAGFFDTSSTFATGFSGSGGGTTLSLNPGMINPVVDASVSNSGSSSSFSSTFDSSSEVARRHTPLTLLPPSLLIMHLPPSKLEGSVLLLHADFTPLETRLLVADVTVDDRGVENPYA